MPAHAWNSSLRWMLATLLAVLLAVGAFNVFIDPLGVFGSPRIAGLNATKPYLDHHRDLSFWLAARRLCPDTGIFGNSRAKVGLDPENPAFARHGLNAFNHAIPGASTMTAYRQLNWLRGAGCMPKTIILGVDFVDFLGGGRAAPLPAPQSDPPPGLDGHFVAETVLSLTGLRDAIHTVLIQRSPYPSTITPRGFTPLLSYIPEVEQSGHHQLFRQRAEESLRSWTRRPPHRAPPAGEMSSDQQELDAILTSAAAAGSTVHLIIYPYHAEIRMLFERIGLGETYAGWKRMIVRSAERHQGGRGAIHVWDFSAISPETREDIPAPADRHTHLKYYWEAGHFKKALGDKLLASVLDDDKDFGVELHADTLEEWLHEDRARVLALLATPSPLRSEVDLLVARNRSK